MNIEDGKDNALPSEAEGKKKVFVKPFATLVHFDSTEESDVFFDCERMPPCAGLVKRIDTNENDS